MRSVGRWFVVLLLLWAVGAAFSVARAGQQPSAAPAATPPLPKPVPPAHALKRILIVGAARGWQHDSIPDAMATIWTLGQTSGLWESYIRTDYDLITRKSAGINAKNLDWFDAIVFVNTTGEMPLDDEHPVVPRHGGRP